MTVRLGIEEVRRRFAERGYVLLETEYKNNATPLLFKCPKHPEKETKITVNRLMSGQGCRYCGYEKLSEQMRLPEEVVIAAFNEKGYTSLDKYNNSSQKLRYVCSKHQDFVSAITYSDLKQGYGCYHCGRERTIKAISGSGSPFWRGGTSALGKYLRQQITEWKLKWLKEYGYRCAITRVNSKELEIHHLTKPFHIVRDETLAELGLDIRDKINDYTTTELHQICKLFIQKHEEVEGVPLLRSIHIEFHKSFGDNPSLEDFLVFKDAHIANKEVTYGKVV